jgi:three-Cys-motif partner protein
MKQTFFDESFEQSKIKSQIVAKYFPAWAKIILGKTKSNIAYIDLFSGPGRYEDGTESTPILVLKTAIAQESVRKRLVAFFTDKRLDYVERLKQEVAKIEGLSLLKYQPKIWQEEVGEKIAEVLKQMKLVPSLVFLDPCGYKGLSIDLINSIIKDWACECIFFFNYNRINAGIHNDGVEEHINGIFGPKRANRLRLNLIGKSPYEREILILRELIAGLKETHGKFVQYFRVKQRERDRTSHYLIFVTKKFLGYEIMRDIMAKQSSNEVQGVPTFEYNKFYKPNLFDKPLDELKVMLLNEYSGQTLNVYDVYKMHSLGRNYIKRNYKEALGQLGNEKKIIASSPSGQKRRKDTMGNSVVVTFP